MYVAISRVENLAQVSFIPEAVVLVVCDPSMNEL